MARLFSKPSRINYNSLAYFAGFVTETCKDKNSHKGTQSEKK
jgi:hypothetical protein